jgi:hypothetical protein
MYASPRSPTPLLWTSLFIALLLPALAWIGYTDLSWGLFSHAPLLLAPHHILLLVRPSAAGPLTRMTTHVLLVAYTAGAVFAAPRAALVLARGPDGCTHGPLACHWWARLAVLGALQAALGAGEAGVLGVLAWRARVAGGAIALPADEEEQRGWCASASINDVQVCADARGARWMALTAAVVAPADGAAGERVVRAMERLTRVCMFPGLRRACHDLPAFVYFHLQLRGAHPRCVYALCSALYYIVHCMRLSLSSLDDTQLALARPRELVLVRVPDPAVPVSYTTKEKRGWGGRTA